MTQLLETIEQFYRTFANSSHLHGVNNSQQQKHAGQVENWQRLTESLMFLSPKEQNIAEDIFEMAYKCSRVLFLLGDEITAWVGQEKIAEAAEKFVPGKQAAHHLALASRLAIYQFLLEEAEASLLRMKAHFDETCHPIAAQFWDSSGMILSLKKDNTQAIPCYQLAREHVERCSAIELKRWLRSPRNSLLAEQNLRIADCLISHGWTVEGRERKNVIDEVRKYLETAKILMQSQIHSYISGLNAVEMNLLEGNLDVARKLTDDLLHAQNIESRKTSVLHPAAYIMKARLADIEGDQKAMISFISRALAESTIMFPDVMQELQVVDYALTLIKSNAMTIHQWKPLLEAMVVMLEAKDWYTGRDHSKSVARTSVRLWDGWQNTLDRTPEPAIRDDLYWAGYLHDIGKLMLPRSLLNKIARLGPSEWRIIHRHPAIAHDMLASLGVARIAQWVLEHHQDMSGNGYPGNTPASDCGLCIALADTLEAATCSVRKYQKPKTHPEIIQELTFSDPQKFPLELLKVAGSLS